MRFTVCLRSQLRAAASSRRTPARTRGGHGWCNADAVRGENRAQRRQRTGAKARCELHSLVRTHGGRSAVVLLQFAIRRLQSASNELRDLVFELAPVLPIRWEHFRVGFPAKGGGSGEEVGSAPRRRLPPLLNQLMRRALKLLHRSLELSSSASADQAFEQSLERVDVKAMLAVAFVAAVYERIGVVPSIEVSQMTEPLEPTAFWTGRTLTSTSQSGLKLDTDVLGAEMHLLQPPCSLEASR